MKELHEALATDENILGYMYWDPIFVDQQVNGTWIKTCWAEKYDSSSDKWWEDGNVISNTTLFDFTGKPLKALYNEIASRHTPDTPSAVEEVANIGSEQSTYKVLSNGQLFIMRDGVFYDLCGRRTE